MRKVTSTSELTMKRTTAVKELHQESAVKPTRPTPAPALSRRKTAASSLEISTMTIAPRSVAVSTAGDHCEENASLNCCLVCPVCFKMYKRATDFYAHLDKTVKQCDGHDTYVCCFLRVVFFTPCSLQLALLFGRLPRGGPRQFTVGTVLDEILNIES